MGQYGGFGSGYNMPPGAYEWMIPGNSAQDAAWENLIDNVPEVCPACGHPTEGDGEYGFADHIRVIEDDHDAEVRCEWEPESEDDDREPCEETLSGGRCRCRDCDPPERDY
jgi:hypothetical protein